MKAFLITAAALLGLIPLSGEVGYVDLTQAESTADVPTAHAKLVDGGCVEFSGGTLADGEQVIQPKNERGKLRIEFSQLLDTTLSVSETVDAEIRMTNSGDQPIEIPWSADAGVIPKGQDPARAVWQVGAFWFKLSGKQNGRLLLASMSQHLYGTKISSASELVIPPGESVRARVAFKIEPFYREQQDQLQEGKWNLSVEWQQMEVAASLKECRQFTGYTDSPSRYFL